MRNKLLTISLIVVVAAIAAYSFPRPKHKSTNIVHSLNIPLRTTGWQGRDFDLGLNERDQRYFFIGDTFSREFRNRYGEGISLLILDAGNFHNPKVCYGSSGYKVKDLPDTAFNAGNRTFKATSIFCEKPGESVLIIYWIVINKQTVDWNRQKIVQLWYSLLNKEKIGLMVRLDIPTLPDRIQNATKLAQEFITDLAPKLEPSETELLFGRNISK